jgi:hypothetical protein
MPEAELVAAVAGRHAELSALRLQLGASLVDAGGRIALPPGALADAARQRFGVER